jgi:hypothetical protein
MKMLRIPKYLVLAVVSSLPMSIIYIYTQVLGIVQNIDLWLTVIPWYNAILFVIFTALFGVTLSFQIYTWQQPKVCSPNEKVKGMGTSSGATFGLFFVAQCPACASLGALFLPVSVMGVLTQFGWLINLLGIGLLLYTINYLGGFKKF